MHPGRALIRTSFVLAALVGSRHCRAAAAPTLKGRAVWASPRDAGTTEASVVAFVEQLAKAHVNTLIMELKTSAGLFWPSERFAPAVVAEYKEFDLPAVLIRECHKREIAFHVWFFDFAEGGDSYVAQQHPEWLALSPEGKPTTAEVLRGQPYRMAWMCPARRPGYTDQWLIPLIKEFAERYDVDAIHHDYVRYPGDLAPDTYCFCDYCLDEIPKYASYYSTPTPTTRSSRPWTARISRPTGRRARGPAAELEGLLAEMKSRLLLEGSFFPGGNRDLDYFFYEYRVHHVAEFTRAGLRGGAEGQAADGVLGRRLQEPRAERALHRPGLAALLRRGSSTSCRWTTAATTPGTSRPTSTCWPRASSSRRSWARDFAHFWPGVAAYQLYDEEREPLTDSGGSSATGARTWPRCRRLSTRSRRGSRPTRPSCTARSRRT